jgi:hypothetical protein
MITIADYWMGRDAKYPLAMTLDIDKHARLMVELANSLITRLVAAGIQLKTNPTTGTIVSSGWRPPAVNSGTPGAAVNSKHMTGQAVDLYDPDGDIDDWLMTEAGQSALTQIGLWMEHPSATKGWSHVQSLPPRSGRRVFFP